MDSSVLLYEVPNKEGKKNNFLSENISLYYNIHVRYTYTLSYGVTFDLRF